MYWQEMYCLIIYLNISGKSIEEIEGLYSASCCRCSWRLACMTLNCPPIMVSMRSYLAATDKWLSAKWIDLISENNSDKSMHLNSFSFWNSSCMSDATLSCLPFAAPKAKIARGRTAGDKEDAERSCEQQIRNSTTLSRSGKSSIKIQTSSANRKINRTHQDRSMPCADLQFQDAGGPTPASSLFLGQE